jgi:hypothetical protein
MTARKRFKEYARPTQINESNWLSKGYAIGQGNRHASTIRQLESLLSKIKNDCNRGHLEEDVTAKFDLLFDAVAGLALSLKLIGELSRANINVSVASNLLEDDLRSLILKTLSKK